MYTLRTIIKWDTDVIDGQRILAEARQKEADMQAFKATVESLMLEILCCSVLQCVAVYCSVM